MTAALIVNPKSRRGGGRGLALAEALKSRNGAPVVVLDQFDGLPEKLRALASQGVDTLFISSGDGTIHAIQTELAERNPFPALPRLALLPHGTTNLTAGDLGFRGSSTDRLVSLIVADPALPETALARRPTMRIANPRDKRVRHGMFLGAGAIARASNFCQGKLHAAGLRGEWANFAALAFGVAEAAFKRGNESEPISKPDPMRAEVDGRPFVVGDELLLLATTLDRLILGSRPFWGGKSAPIRITTVGYPPPSVPRWLLTLLYGGEERKVPASCASVSGKSLTVETAAPFLLDGEFFDAPLHEPLRIETGPEFTYIRGVG